MEIVALSAPLLFPLLLRGRGGLNWQFVRFSTSNSLSLFLLFLFSFHERLGSSWELNPLQCLSFSSKEPLRFSFRSYIKTLITPNEY